MSYPDLIDNMTEFNGIELGRELRDLMKIHSPKLEKFASGKQIKFEELNDRSTYFTDDQNCSKNKGPFPPVLIAINLIANLNPYIMATRGTATDKKKVNSSQDYELYHVAEKMGVSIQQVTGAKRATASNDRKVIEKYISNKKKSN